MLNPEGVKRFSFPGQRSVSLAFSGDTPSALPGISPTSSEIGWGDASVISSVSE
jgi:hypothetical protein